jgi:hypothetical protein
VANSRVALCDSLYVCPLLSCVLVYVRLTANRATNVESALGCNSHQAVCRDTPLETPAGSSEKREDRHPDMHDLPRKNTRKTRGRPFERGNPGRPKGSRNKATLLAETIFDGEAEALCRKAVELALSGDLAALKLCLDRLLPPRRERLCRYDLPPVNNLADVSRACRALLAAASRGDLAPGEANALRQLLEGYANSVLVHDLEERLIKLEERKQ